MVGRGEARTGLDDRRRHAEPHVDLGELATGRAAAQDDAGSVGSSRASVASRLVQVGTVVEARDRRHLGARTDRDDDMAPVQLVLHAVVADRRRGHDR